MLGSCIRLITTEINVGISELVHRMAFNKYLPLLMTSGKEYDKRVDMYYSGCWNVHLQLIQNTCLTTKMQQIVYSFSKKCSRVTSPDPFFCWYRQINLICPGRHQHILSGPTYSLCGPPCSKLLNEHLVKINDCLLKRRHRTCYVLTNY